MNLKKLFETQKKLDDRIVAEKGLQGVDLLDKKILALQVELGELAQNWRGFKFWSEDQDPRNYCQACQLIETPHKCINPLLEEYVDCLHFILSIGNEFNMQGIVPVKIARTKITFALNEIFEVVGRLRNRHVRNAEYQWLINEFFNLGEMLGFTVEQIEQAYYEKNKVNHERQESGY